MSGSIRRRIGLEIHLLQKRIEVAKKTLKEAKNDPHQATDELVSKTHKDLAYIIPLLNKSTTLLDQLDNEWRVLQKEPNEQAEYKTYIDKYGDYHTAWYEALGLIDELTPLKDDWLDVFQERIENDTMQITLPPYANQAFLTAAEKVNIVNSRQPENNPSQPEHNLQQEYLAQATTFHNYSPLPPITIPLFSGDITEWCTFIELFKSLVDSLPIKDVLKFYHLRSFLRGDALKVVSGLPMTAENYKVAQNLLEKAFGQKYSIIHTLRSKFLNFESRGTSAQDLSKSLRHIKALYEQLKSLGEDLNSPSHAQLIESRFPNWINSKALKKLYGTNPNLESLLNTYSEILEIEEYLERTKRDNQHFIQRKIPTKADNPPPPKYNQSNNYQNHVNDIHHNDYHDQNQTFSSTTNQNSSNENTVIPENQVTSNESTFATSQQRTQRPCLFCNAIHNIFRCPLPQKEKLRVALSQHRCTNCLSNRHPTDQCASQVNCQNCNERHHTTLCKKSSTNNQEQTTNPPQNNSTNHNQVHFTQMAISQQQHVPQNTVVHPVRQTEIDHIHSDDESFSASDAAETLMPCAQAEISHPNGDESLTAMVFFDSGSSRSYITKELADTLNLPTLGEQELSLSTFASEEPIPFSATDVSLLIRTKNGPKDLILSIIPNKMPLMRNITLTELNLTVLREEPAVPLTFSQIRPQILIGSDYLWDIFFDHTTESLPSGFIILHTIMGSMLTGKGKLKQMENPLNSITFSSVENSSPTTKGTSPTNPKPFKSRKFYQNSAQTIYNQRQKIAPTNPCRFCSELHNIFRCPLHDREKLEIIINKNWCVNCLGTRHLLENCNSKSRCQNCEGKHHTTICLAIPIYHNPPNQASFLHETNQILPPEPMEPLSISIPETNFDIPSKSCSLSDLTSNPTSTNPSFVSKTINEIRQICYESSGEEKSNPSILVPDQSTSTPDPGILIISKPANPEINPPLRFNFTGFPYHIPELLSTTISLSNVTIESLPPCAEVFITHPDKKEGISVEVCINTGTTLSYISANLARQLELPFYGRENIPLTSFFNHEPSFLPTAQVSLHLHTDHQVIPVFLFTTPHPFPLVKYIPRSGINFSTIKNATSIPANFKLVKPKIILGSDYFWPILSQNKIEILPSGFTLLQTILGPIITGRGRIKPLLLSSSAI